jgi:hypothetical protein
MAQRALQPGTTQTRGRALFGLLDASGWGWASVKAAFWFILMIFLLGYIPDRAYYFTVNKTLDLGILAWSPVNFCPPENQSLPCPAPVGAVVPWDVAPAELSLKENRTDGVVGQAGTKILYIGGSDGTAATKTTFVADTRGVGNFGPWSQGPDLPAARSNAGLAFFGGKIYLVGGSGADGKPTSTVFVLSPNSQTGELGKWQTAKDAKLDLDLPEPRTGAAVVAGADGLFLLGGSADGKTPLKSVWKSTLDPKTGNLKAWAPQADPGLYVEAMDATAVQNGDYLGVYGGTSATGPMKTVQRGEFGTGTESTTLKRFGVAGGTTDLPEARTDAAGFAANGALYLVGGSDGTKPRSELYWAVPNSSGNIPEWKHLPVSDLPASGLAGSAPVVLGPNIILVGGTTASGPIAGSARANIAPQPPFFQVGLVGATVPALKIDGEIGQQLGYLNANTVGIVNFVILLIVGWAFAHKEQVRAMRERLRQRVRGRR